MMRVQGRSAHTLVAMLPPTFGQFIAKTRWKAARTISYKLGNKSNEHLYQYSEVIPMVKSALPTSHLTTQVLFNNQQSVDFKNIWLRDNCMCPQCVDKMTQQKLLDTPSLDINARPESMRVSDNGNLIISWREKEQKHISTFSSRWLYRYGQSFIDEVFESPANSLHPNRASRVLWDGTNIWKQLPEVSYNEMMESDSGLKKWLEMIHKYGIAILRNVPPVQGKLIEVVKRFAYVKETHYGATFDVVNQPDPTAHLAFSGLHLHHHTDMNYRETSPGLQMLHCLKANDLKESSFNPGGLSFFVDGFRVAKWLEKNEPNAFHILTSTPLRFKIENNGKVYSQLWPVICMDQDGEVTEIHYNNRTTGPLQAPSNIVVPFYRAYKNLMQNFNPRYIELDFSSKTVPNKHCILRSVRSFCIVPAELKAYKLFSEKMRAQSSEMRFQMLPGDLVAFNNRRILHGRTGFDPLRVSRHLVGCYVDIDEVVSIYNAMLDRN